MQLNVFLFATFLGLAGGAPSACAQGKTDPVHSYPGDVRFQDPKAMARAANQALSPRERADFCGLGRSYLKFACRVDSSGRIEAITHTALLYAAQSLPAAALSRIRERIRRDVLFYVPKAFRPDSRSYYRQMTLALPLKAFCKNNK